VLTELHRTRRKTKKSALSFYENKASAARESEQNYSLYSANNSTKLVSSNTAESEIDAGEIVVISPQDEENQESGSLVAYVYERTDNDDDTEYALDILSQRAVAITYVKDNALNQRHYGLYLPVDEKYNRHASLVIDKQDYSPAQRFQVKLNNQMFLVKPKEMVKDTDSFVQFRFSAVKATSVSKAS
jgi:hypothetical protein